MYCVIILHSACTGADVQNVVVSILGLDSVHSDLSQLSPTRLCLQQDRSTVPRKDWTVHHGVRTHEPQNLVRKLLGAGEATAIDFAGALLKRWWGGEKGGVGTETEEGH